MGERGSCRAWLWFGRAVWSEKAGGILFSQNGTPAKLEPTGKLESYSVAISQESSVQTAGGVVSTGSAAVNDVGRLRTPFRGWFLPDTGQDMELNGCVPDAIVWPKPSELPEGIDRQLDKAVELLLQEVGQGPAAKELIYATERAK